VRTQFSLVLNQTVSNDRNAAPNSGVVHPAISAVRTPARSSDAGVTGQTFDTPKHGVERPLPAQDLTNTESGMRDGEPRGFIPAVSEAGDRREKVRCNRTSLNQTDDPAHKFVLILNAWMRRT
jgi:hypothetical protein